MAQLDKLETALDEALNKKAPFKIPENGRKTIASNLWWVALGLGVLQLWAAWELWRMWDRVDEAVNAVNEFSAYYGISAVDGPGMFFYLALLVLAADAVVLLLAAPGLKAMKKAGWTLAFYSVLLNVLYGVVILFAGNYGGLRDFLWAGVTSVAVAYLLFQVRGHFMKSHAAHKAS